MKGFIRTLVALGVLLAGHSMGGCATTTIYGTVKMPSNKGVAPTSISVNDFRGGQTEQGDMVARMIAGALQKEGHVRIVDRNGEGALSGKLDIGRLDTKNWQEEREYKKEKYTDYYLKAEKSVSVSYELNLGGTIIADSYVENYSQQWSAESSSAARAKLPPEKAINDQLLTQAALKIAQDLSPHKVTMKFEFHNGDDDNIEVGIQYVKHQRYDQAMDVFRQVKAHTPELEDVAAATYNMGLIREMNGEFKQAFELFSEANQLQPGEEDYIAALSRAESHYQLQQQYEHQVNRH